MKFGKEFQQILSDSHFPEEWKSSAIEYGQVSFAIPHHRRTKVGKLIK
jgi:hypothetical protein